MLIEYARPFKKSFDKLPEKIREAFINRGRIFENNPFHPLLNNHALRGDREGYRSINITGDWRAIFREFDEYQLVRFEAIGTHSQLYKK